MVTDVVGQGGGEVCVTTSCCDLHTCLNPLNAAEELFRGQGEDSEKESLCFESRPDTREILQCKLGHRKYVGFGIWISLLRNTENKVLAFRGPHRMVYGQIT